VLSKVQHVEDISTPEVQQILQQNMSKEEYVELVLTNDEMLYLHEAMSDPKKFAQEVINVSKGHKMAHKIFRFLEVLVIVYTLIDLIETEYQIYQCKGIINQSQDVLKKNLGFILQKYDMVEHYSSETISDNERNKYKSELSNLVVDLIFPIQMSLVKEEGRMEEKKLNKMKLIVVYTLTFVGSLFTFNGWSTFSWGKKISTSLLSLTLLGETVYEISQYKRINTLLNEIQQYTEVLNDIESLKKSNLSVEEKDKIYNDLGLINKLERVEVENYGQIDE